MRSPNRLSSRMAPSRSAKTGDGSKLTTLLFELATQKTAENNPECAPISKKEPPLSAARITLCNSTRPSGVPIKFARSLFQLRGARNEREEPETSIVHLRSEDCSSTETWVFPSSINFRLKRRLMDVRTAPGMNRLNRFLRKRF